MKKIIKYVVVILLILCIKGAYEANRESVGIFDNSPLLTTVRKYFPDGEGPTAAVSKLQDVPEYNGSISIQINNNVPFFSDKDKALTESFESYSKLDSRGRCGPAFANLGVDIAPTEPRGDISEVRPTGWEYDGKSNQKKVNGQYVYHRCHLIGYQLAGENENVKNLITGTRDFNVEAMLPYENMVAKYVHSTNNHVLYRVTPYFEGNNAVAKGVLMEAWSVEDNGKLSFCVFCYNVQSGVSINYETGELSVK